MPTRPTKLASAGSAKSRSSVRADPALVGRTTELGVLRELVDAAEAGESGALVLRGEPGIGKTALLDAASELASERGMATPSVAGIEAEAPIGFAALQRLLRFFPDLVDRLPAPQRAAIRSTLGLDSGCPPDRYLVGLGVVTLLAEAASAGPLLVVIDDAQWLDPESGIVFGFAARRLQDEGTVMLFAIRDSDEGGPALASLPELTVGRLPDSDAAELVSTVTAGLVSPVVRARLVEECRGNPMALVEFSRELTKEQLIGAAVLPDPLAAPNSLQQLFARRLLHLTRAARVLLGIAAAEPAASDSLVWNVAKRLGVDADNAAIEIDGLVRFDNGIRFSHPLVRSVAFYSLPPPERRRIHRAVAHELDPVTDHSDRVAWHLAMAATGPDELVANQLTEAAERERNRGAYAAASRLLQRAAALSVDEHLGAERLLLASEAGVVAGDIGAGKFAERAAPRLNQPLARARARRVQGLCLQANGQTAEGVRMLVDAALEMAGADPGRARDTLLEAFSAAQLDGWLGPQMAEVLPVAPRLPKLATSAPGDELLDGFAALHEGCTPEGYELLRKGVQSLTTGDNSPDNKLPRLVAWLYAAGLLFDHSAWEDLERQWMPAFRDRGAVAALVPALFSLGFNHLRLGSVSAAEASLFEGRTLAEAAGHQGWLDGFSAVDVWLLGLRGQGSEGRALGARLLMEPLPNQWRDVVCLGIAVLELGAGRYQAALDAAVDAQALWTLLSPEDAVEAAVRCGQSKIARAALDDFSPLAAAAGTPWALGITARCEALLAGDDPTAEDSYQSSIDLLQRTPVAFSLARSHLVYGEWLRRRRRRRDARRHLRTALESFEHTGALGFAERARSELYATGERSRERSDQTRLQLTPQETQIARLAVEGAKNRDIASQLFLSTATVDYHLRNVYRKLGVSTRTQLARTIAN